MENLLFLILGYLFLWLSTDIGRSKDCEIKIFSFNWFVILILLIIGMTIVLFGTITYLQNIGKL